MTIGLPCNSCTNGICGNCVAEKSEDRGFIRSAKYHCACANKGHTNNKFKELPNKTVFSSKRDTEPVPSREIQADFDDDFTDKNDIEDSCDSGNYFT